MRDLQVEYTGMSHKLFHPHVSHDTQLQRCIISHQTDYQSVTEHSYYDIPVRKYRSVKLYNTVSLLSLRDDTDTGHTGALLTTSWKTVRLGPCRKFMGLVNHQETF